MPWATCTVSWSSVALLPWAIGPTKAWNMTEVSKALTTDELQFVGLPLDDENQFDLTDTRIQQWCEQLEGEFGLQRKQLHIRSAR